MFSRAFSVRPSTFIRWATIALPRSRQTTELCASGKMKVAHLMNVLGRTENARLNIGHGVWVGGLIGRVAEDRQTELILIPMPEVAGSEGDAACRSFLNRQARSCSGQRRST